MNFCANLGQFCSHLSSVGMHETARVCSRAAELPGTARWALCRGLWAAAWAEGKGPSPVPQPSSPLALLSRSRTRLGPAAAQTPPCTRTGITEGRSRPCSRPFPVPVGALGGPARRSRHLITGAVRPRCLRPRCSTADMASTSRYGGARGRSGSGTGTDRKWPRRPRCRRGTERRPSPPLPGPGAAVSARPSLCTAPRPLSGVPSVEATPWGAPGAAGAGPQSARACSCGPGRAGPGGPRLSGLSRAELAAFASSCRYFGSRSEDTPRFFGGFMTWVRGSSLVAARCERRPGPVPLPSAGPAWPGRAVPWGPEVAPSSSRRVPRPGTAWRSPPVPPAQPRLEPRCSSLAWLHLIGPWKLLLGSHPKSVPAPDGFRALNSFFLGTYRVFLSSQEWRKAYGADWSDSVTPAKPVLGSRKCFLVVLVQLGSYLLRWALAHVPCIFLRCRWLSKLSPLQRVQFIYLDKPS